MTVTAPSSETLSLRFAQNAELRAAGFSAFNPSRARALLTRAAMFLGGLVFGGLLVAMPWINPKYILLVLVGYLLNFAVTRFFSWRHMRVLQHLEDSSMTGRGDLEIEIAPDALSVSAPGITSQIAWGAVDAVLDLGKFVGLRMGARCIVIPIAALPKGMTKMQLIQMLEARRTFG